MCTLTILALCSFAGVAVLASAKDSISVVDKPKPGKGRYVGNVAPLQPSLFLKLPIGSIKPGGWLLKQLQLEAEGFSGRLSELSPWLKQEGNAWLAKDGKGHSGWEELPYWLKGFGDLGYVLDDKRIIDEARVWLEGAFASQRENGYFGPESNLTNADGKPDLWPNMPMLNSLQSYYEFSGDKRVLEFMMRYFKWELALPEKDYLVNRGAGYWQNQRGGDNLASIYWLYNRTREPWLLELAEKTHRCTADWTSGVANWHGVNFAQSFREPTTYWMQSGLEKHHIASKRDLHDFREMFGQVPGGMYGADENARKGYSDPRQAAETCAFVEMMYADEMLLLATADLSWADHCEDVAYNSLPASMTADLKALRYLTAPNQPQSDKGNKSPGIENSGPMYHFDPFDHRCCQHNAAMGWPYFAEHQWMATADNGLAAMFYSENAVTAKVGSSGSVTIHEKTQYPFRDKVSFNLSLSKPCRFPLYLRIPAWCSSASLSVNGKALAVSSQPGKLIRVERTWSNGDKVELVLPMKVTLKTYTANQNAVSIQRGPLSYSLKITEKSEVDGGSKKWPATSLFADSSWNYGLILNGTIEVVEKAWPSSGQPFQWDAAPVELKAKGRKIDAWKLDYQGLVHKLQASPALVDTPEETLTLIPMGCARLRIAAFPTVVTSGSGHKWIKPKNPTPAEASHVHSADTLFALSDGIYPSSSSDQSLPRFTWWDHKGTEEWVQINFADSKLVSSVSVYWFDDRATGNCRPPESWTLSYWTGSEWAPVESASGYGVLLNQSNEVRFKPVKTTKLRLTARLLKGFSAGILEWDVK